MDLPLALIQSVYSQKGSLACCVTPLKTFHKWCQPELTTAKSSIFKEIKKKENNYLSCASAFSIKK